MSQRTALYDKHLEAGAKMVDFAGWDMPIHYGSQIEEHKQVRQDAGMFDVSHMVIIDLEGAASKAFLQKLLANDVDRLKDAGKALPADPDFDREAVLSVTTDAHSESP